MNNLIPMSVEQMRRDSIKRIEEQKKRQETFEKLRDKKINQQNLYDVHSILKSNAHKEMKETYYNPKLLNKEYEDFLSFHQLYQLKDFIKDHIKDKSNTNDVSPYLIRKEMKYIDEILNKYKVQHNIK